MSLQLDAFLLSFAVIFVAELGDKSQLMALAFATRYRAIDVLVGITLATLLVHLGSVVLGATIAAALPTEAIAIIGGLAFFVFAAWTLRGDRLDDDEAGRATRPTRSVILAVGTAFFLAELGDKTMLATITLATREEAARDVARIDRWDDRRRCDRHRHRSLVGDATPGASDPLSRGRPVRAVRHRTHRRGTGLVHDRPVNRGGPLRLPHITRGRRR